MDHEVAQALIVDRGSASLRADPVRENPKRDRRGDMAVGLIPDDDAYAAPVQEKVRGSNGEVLAREVAPRVVNVELSDDDVPGLIDVERFELLPLRAE